jgi:plastocyanin
MLALGALLAAALFSAGAVSAGGGCHASDARATESSGTAVRIEGCTFGPTILRVASGVTVTFVNDSAGEHAVTGNGWGTIDILEPGDQVRHRFTDPGIYPYQCYLHPGMSGAIVVGGSGAADSVAAEPVSADLNGGSAVQHPSGPGVATTMDAPAAASAIAIPALLGLAAGLLIGRWRPDVREVSVSEAPPEDAPGD